MDGDKIPSLGQVAYEAYGADRGWVTYDGSPMPKWDDLSPNLRRSWNAAAAAVAYVKFDDPVPGEETEDEITITRRFLGKTMIDDKCEAPVSRPSRWTPLSPPPAG